MDYTRDERRNATRDALSLLRAMHEGNDDLYYAVLDTAGDRGRRGIAEALVNLACDSMLRLFAAVNQLPTEDRTAILSADHAELATIPGLSKALSANLEALQAELAAEDLPCRAGSAHARAARAAARRPARTACSTTARPPAR